MNFEGKEIVLFGSIRSCERFYLQIRKFLSVKAVVTDDEKKYQAMDEKSILPVRYIKKWLDYEKEHTYIICCYHTESERHSYDDIMERAGLFFDEDYTDAWYVLSWLRQRLEVDWAEREIWIFGAGNNGKHFYENYRDCGVNITGFLSNFESENDYMGLPVIRPGKLDQRKKPYIIICSDAWEEMGGYLDALGYESIRDYCFSEWIPKKMFVSMGPCQIHHTAVMLRKNRRFMLMWDSLLIFENIDTFSSPADKRRFCVYGDVADVVFYRSKSLGDDNLPDKGHDIAEKYYKNAMKIFIPFYYFRGQLMQASQTLNPYMSKIALKWPVWIRGDQEINRLVDNGVSVDEIVETVSDIDYWSEEEIQMNYKKELQKIKILDRISDIKIHTFIEEHYQEYPIFRDGTHFGIELTIYIANEILHKIGLAPFSETEIEKAVLKTPGKWKNVMPIYPCVMQALGIHYKEHDGTYPIVKPDGVVDWVDFTEYIRRYAEYVYSVKKIFCENGSVF